MPKTRYFAVNSGERTVVGPFFSLRAAREYRVRHAARLPKQASIEVCDIKTEAGNAEIGRALLDGYDFQVPKKRREVAK